MSCWQYPWSRTVQWSAPNRQKLWGFSLPVCKCNPTQHTRADADTPATLVTCTAPAVLVLHSAKYTLFYINSWCKWILPICCWSIYLESVSQITKKKSLKKSNSVQYFFQYSKPHVAFIPIDFATCISTDQIKLIIITAAFKSNRSQYFTITGCTNYFYPPLVMFTHSSCVQQHKSPIHCWMVHLILSYT